MRKSCHFITAFATNFSTKKKKIIHWNTNVEGIIIKALLICGRTVFKTRGSTDKRDTSIMIERLDWRDNVSIIKWWWWRSRI